MVLSSGKSLVSAEGTCAQASMDPQVGLVLGPQGPLFPLPLCFLLIPKGRNSCCQVG